MLYICSRNHMGQENKDVKMTAEHKHIQTHLICIQSLRCVCLTVYAARKIARRGKFDEILIKNLFMQRLSVWD